MWLGCFQRVARKSYWCLQNNLSRKPEAQHFVRTSFGELNEYVAVCSCGDVRSETYEVLRVVRRAWQSLES